MTQKYFKQLIAENKTEQAIKELMQLIKTNEIALLSARFNEMKKSYRIGTGGSIDLNMERNRINAALLELIEDIDDNGSVGVNNQKYHGNGDNIGGDKINRQINMGNNSTYVEKQHNELNIIPQKKQILDNEKQENKPAQPLPETPSGFLGQLFQSIPKPWNYLVAVALLGFIAFGAYKYFIEPKANDVKKLDTIKVDSTSTAKKVYVSGKIFINNGEPRPNEITRLVLSGMNEVNAARIDGTGKYTFENVTIPVNKKLLVEVTFADKVVLPTEEINVGKVNPDNNTVSLPNLYATRPQPPKNGKPGTGSGWKIQVNVNTGNGTLKANQN